MAVAVVVVVLALAAVVVVVVLGKTFPHLPIVTSAVALVDVIGGLDAAADVLAVVVVLGQEEAFRNVVVLVAVVLGRFRSFKNDSKLV